MSKSNENEKKIAAHEDQTNIVVKNLSDEVQSLKNELTKRDQLLKHMETKFDSYQEKSVQFYDILKLCEAQISKPVVVAADESQTDLMHDIRSELKKLSRKKEKKDKKLSKEKSERGDSE